jgi:hypothetical protein
MCQELVLYDGPSNDQYEVFWVEFIVSLYKSLKWLEEALEYKNQQKKSHNGLLKT